MKIKNLFPIGSIVRSINGETDSDENDNDRETGPNAHGRITCYSPRCGYGVTFTNGTSVYLEHEELENTDEYDVSTPEQIAANLTEIRRYNDRMNALEQVPDGNAYNHVLSFIGA